MKFPLLALLSLIPTVAWTQPLPFTTQPVNFYWRGELYGMPNGWQNKDLPLTEEQGREFLRTLNAGLNPVMFWRTQPEAIAQPDADEKGYYYREIDYDLAASKGSGAKMLFQIHVDRPPNWYAPMFPGRVSQVHPAYDVRTDHVQVEQGGWPEHIFNPDNKEMMADAEKMIRTSINRYKANPQVKGFLIGAGIGQVEMVLNHHGLPYGHSPDEQKAFKTWLRDRYSLGELSKRWQGRADYYKSWDEVRVPAPHEFFGWGPLQDIPLTGNLREGEKGEFWVRSGEQAETILLDASWGREGSAVIALPAPLPKKEYPEKQTVMRREFSVTPQELETFRKQGVWLYGEGAMRVVLNGHDLGTLDGRSTDPAPGIEGEVERAFPFNPFAVRVEDKLQEGTNVISLLPAKGLAAPLFLSQEPPVRYPYLGKERNARYVDWLRWAYDRAAAVHDYFYAVARSLAPDAQLVIFSPHGGLLDAAGEMALKYNVAIRFTGGEAYYYPWYARTGLITGYPGSVEPSAPIKTEKDLHKSLGWWFFNNDQDMAFFWDLSNYASPNSPVREPMLKAAPLLNLFGKYSPTPPTLAFLRTSLQFQLEEYFMHPLPFLWDPGRGEVQKSGIEFGYVTETPLSRGLPDNVKVMMDTGTSVMEETVLQDLEQWIRDGGTFIALHHTGRHSLLVANAWPISRISGFDVTGFAGQDEKIRFEEGQKLWPSLSGERSGSGNAVDFTGQNAAGGGIRLKPAAEDCEVIARWADGSVAIGRRPLGDGQVIVLGSTFWRNGRDSAGIYSSNSATEQPWLTEMLGNLGVPVPVPVPSSSAWVREATSLKDGKPQLIVLNPTEQPLRDVTLPMGALSGTPVDLVSGEGAKATAPKSVAAPERVSLIDLDTGRLPSIWPGPEVELKTAEAGQVPSSWLEIRNWEKGVSLTGEFDLSSAEGGDLSLIVPLRGNGLPVPLMIYLYDAEGGYRYFTQAGGRKLTLDGTDWVVCHIALDPSRGDAGGDSERSAEAKPFDPARVVRIVVAPAGKWKENLPSDSPEILPSIGLGAIELEKSAASASYTPGIRKKNNKELVFDLQPYQTRVIESR